MHPQWNTRNVGSIIARNSDNAPGFNPPEKHNFLSPDAVGGFPTTSVHWASYFLQDKNNWPLGDRPGNARFSTSIIQTLIAEPQQISGGGAADVWLQYNQLVSAMSKGNHAQGRVGY